jgi:ferredoxin
MDGEWCANSTSMVMHKPISPVTAGSSVPYLSTRWILTITGSVFWAAELLLSASSEKTSPSRDFLITRCVSAIDYRIGGAEFEVTQPRVTCYRVTIRTAWDPKFASLLELAEACDVPVRWSCRIGVCHTCMTGLIDGSISYNPEPLERPTSGNVLICCSQPNSGVTLDL